MQIADPSSNRWRVRKARTACWKKIVSSFTKLSTDYFKQLSDKPTNIRYVGGSVGASCALGVADAIVDLVESGETMKAAGLKAIETILETSAHLISSKKVNSQKWSI